MKSKDPSIINNKLKISFNKPFHKFVLKESFNDINSYRKFINWIIGEFDLNLKEESDNLQVFFPNEQLTISKYFLTNEMISAEIKVKSRTIHNGFSLMEKVECIYRNLKKTN